MKGKIYENFLKGLWILQTSANFKQLCWNGYIY